MANLKWFAYTLEKCKTGLDALAYAFEIQEGSNVLH